MDAKRLYYGLLGLICLLLVGLLAGAYSANNLLSQRADRLITLKAKSQALDQQQIRLEQAKKDIQKYADLEKIAKAVVPEDKNQAEAVRELVNIAAANNIVLGSITFPASTLGTTSGSSTSTSTTTPAKPPPPVSTNSPANKLSQLVLVPGIPGVYQLVITVTSSPTHPIQYNQIINFLSGLENNRRTAQVTSINLQPTTNNSRFINFTLTLNEYIKP